jgi:hypothetical protein
MKLTLLSEYEKEKIMVNELWQPFCEQLSR